MKFIYGRSSWEDGWRGEENCYLLTNGLGGFSSATMIGSSARNDHSFFMACTKAPNHRYSMIHRLEEILELNGSEIHLSSQKYTDEARDEEGCRFLDGFCFEDYPRWLFHADGVEIEKEIAMKQGENKIAVRYRIENRTAGEIVFRVIPHLQFCPKGRQPQKGQEFVFRRKAGQETKRPEGACAESRNPDDFCGGEFAAASNGLELYFSTNGTVHSFPARFVSGLYYAYDECDGRDPVGNTYVNHQTEKKAAAGECVSLEIVYWMNPDGSDLAGSGFAEASGIFNEAVRYREELAKTSGLQSETARVLAKSAGQFVAERESVGGKTILAGFPFFEDWGRDTMIAVAGCCISTGQFETAKSILRTFAAYCREGLMPNLFPEGKTDPMYNTADASLLFINAVYLYYEKQVSQAACRRNPDPDGPAADLSGAGVRPPRSVGKVCPGKTAGLDFVREMWPVICEIIDWYKRGTAFGIHMEDDGLLAAGQGMDQVTWMDVRINDILPTPRHGKPVEVNAYWYNALCVAGLFGRLLNQAETGPEIREYDALAQKAGKSFQEKFWNEEASCLKDVLSGTDADGQIRCNQIWAVSLPFCALDAVQQKKVVDTVFEKLYTPYGLRTLAKEDPEFHGKYGGSQLKRDLAYHQGTVWVFPLGAYYLAYLKTERYSSRALETVRRQLEPLESALREGCIGQLPEIYDGEFPSFSRGCFAQAWSVGEILRVYEALEAHGIFVRP